MRKFFNFPIDKPVKPCYTCIIKREENKEMTDIKWQEVSITERKAVVEMYNKYYNTEKEPLSF